MERTLFFSLAFLASSAHAGIDFSPVTTPLAEYVANDPEIPGAGLLIVDFDGTVHLEQYFGEFDRHQVVPIASATKWLSAGVIMSLVDDGLLDLDKPVGETLNSFDGRPLKEDMTVRQAFSHTGGGGDSFYWLTQKDITLQQSANGIALTSNWIDAPGELFHYGGISMQVAARAGELVGGDDWFTLMNDRIKTPLGVTDIDYDGQGPTTNPHIGGGGRASMESYSRFLRMIADGGVYNGQQVLSPEAIATMLSDQTGDATLDYAPPSLQQYLGYGIGNWVMREDEAGEPVEFASPGAFGTTPWIDLENRYFGLLMIEDSYASIATMMDSLRAYAREALSMPGDFNRDGLVDQQDFEVWRADYGSSDSYADGNDDGVVDSIDYAIWREALSKNTLIGADARPNAAPAPASAALVGGCWLLAVSLRRRLG